MVKRISRIVLLLFGLFFGYAIGNALFAAPAMQLTLKYSADNVVLEVVSSIACSILFGLIFYFLSPKIVKLTVKIAKTIEHELEKIPVNQIISGSVGLIIGLLIAYLISPLFKIIPIDIVSTALTVVSYGFLAYLGVNISNKNFSDFGRLTEVFKKSGFSKNSSKSSSNAKPKILDTSVIIDGRIADICKTGFIEGEVIIPEFVLEELRHIADSSDGLKRNRGRRGLDILKMIQEDLQVEVRIVDTDFEDVNEVDIKLLKLAQKMNGFVVTNDFNLNKVASLQGVPILNINELANAVKPVVMPGEEMVVTIIKEGKESNQGIAYFDDGTMIVVEGARKSINVTMKVLVTSVLQTAAGRMIFAKQI
ncbi:MAG: PIN/TRAM domain-containing protein [Acidaminobacteraceae bacterium]